MIQPIVEGDGDILAVPKLLHRLTSELSVGFVKIGKPLWIRRNQIVKRDHLEKGLRQARNKSSRAVLILFDSDDDCARNLIPQMNQWASEIAPDIPTAIVMARREYEAWFLAALESLRDSRDISADAAFTGNPEVRRDAKKILSGFMAEGPYKETVDQPRFTSSFDLGQAYRNSSSFRKLVKEFIRVLTELGYTPALPEHWT